MGYAPWEMREDSKFWLKRLHPEDSSRVFHELATLIGQGGGTIEYRFRHRRGHYIWIQDTFTTTKNKDGTPKELIGSWADITDRKKIEVELKRLAGEVEVRNRFIRETFGRYLTDEVVSTLLDSPSGLQMGGEQRKVTMLMADLRGFTSLSERMDPKWVVSILNRYLSTMVTIVKKYGGPASSAKASSVQPADYGQFRTAAYLLRRGWLYRTTPPRSRPTSIRVCGDRSHKRGGSDAY
jgi:PAS domain S-box-containing protein